MDRQVLRSRGIRVAEGFPADAAAFACADEEAFNDRLAHERAG